MSIINCGVWEGKVIVVIVIVIVIVDEPCWESTAADKVKEAHRRVMVANHPDAGGSHYLASKINEAKDILLGKTKSGGSAF
ncbi:MITOCHONDRIAL IMPORT INNER MEMBRANE TRANSLOCASE SUBUNIT TIM14-2 [Salix koriyanagi]|uniref:MITOCHONDRIAL IMPORT INNER MEMBRANE TRANSLOCASE SUBUNIT TIM14-2 n=1 Tax=Salix koriyanagi TaxID=2511006 RepID=A0A9Q0VDZ9_9ROSI|nr:MITOCHONDRIAL IMPORT INNER MEMBRANE TRANSLOCASE SUBUNIT TIM14-2 [Salix koriyanagi]